MLSVPELKNLVAVSREYVKGETGFAELHSAVSNCHKTSIVMGLDEQIQLLFMEYQGLVDRVWNEWGLQENPVTEDELKDWIKNEFLDDCDENYQRFKANT